MAIHSFKHRGTLDRSATADLFRHTLARIPSVYGRLMYLGSLRDPNNGAYRHYGLATAFGPEQSAKALETSHSRTFREWLKLPLRQRHADLVSYLETLDDPGGRAVTYWLESKGYLGCIPDNGSKADRAYFTKEMERLLKVVSSAAAGARSGPKSLRRK